MESNKKQEEEIKIVPWEDYQQELARFSSLSSALQQANHNKNFIQHKLHSLLHLEAESLKWSNELDEMREKLESRKLVMGNMSMQSKVVREKTKKQEEQLNSKIRSLLMAGSALSVANRQLQEANKSLGGEGGYVPLRNLQKFLRARQQFLVSQVSLLYPVKVVTGHTHDQQPESYTGRSGPGNPSAVKPLDAASLTISGVHLSVRPFTKMNFFTDKKEILSSATALGYVAHAVSLIGLYIKLPLRYPIRLGASRTYICDYAPSLEAISDLTSNSLPYSTSKPMEFPLFLDSQDTTRSAYAVFLLNKDVEQLLNFIGVESLGPRHVLVNFKQLLNHIFSREYIDT
ncbi:hypothetical protein CTI12_AA392980 [Artemisia annua]|uniref:UV radiation resistance protein/autophagy-related protein 14 n=2 Tax=Artemisia annua TaxID=35608 RepID=A0A2U1MDM9_ARTAN|nr:hypothetical protein CTI12_AA392980 [Artemisia annua]